MNMKWMMVMSVILFAGTASLQAQTKLDSLLNVFKNAGRQTDAEILTQIAIEYKNQYKYAKAIEYSEKLLAAGQAKGSVEIMAKAHENMAEVYNLSNELSKSLIEERRALELVNKNENSSLLADIYSGFAAIFLNTSIYDSAIIYTNHALRINKALNNMQGMATGNFFLAVIEINKGNNFLSLSYYEQALQYIRKTDNRNYEAQILGRMATAYINIGDYPKAVEKCLNSLSVLSKGTLKGRAAVAYTRLGSLYRKMGDLDKALYYLDKSKETIEKYGVMGNNLAVLYTEYGSLCDVQGAYEKGLEYKMKSLAFNEKIELNDQMMSDNDNIGVSYHKLKKYATAFSYFDKALLLAQQFSDSVYMCTIINNMADAYADAPDSVLKRLRINVAERNNLVTDTYNRALKIAREINNIEVQQEVLKSLSETYEQQKDYPKAFIAYKEFVDIKDKIFNNKSKQQITRLEIQYEFSKKEDSLKLQKSITDAQLLQQQFLNKQQSQNLLLQNNKLLLSQQQLALSNKEKDLQHLAFLKTEADLQTEQLQKSEKEKQLTIAQKEKQLQSAEVKTLSQENDLNKLRRRQQLIYGAGGFACLFFGGLLFFNRSRHKQAQLKADLEKEKAQQEQKEAEFQRSLADVSMSALRSQMNPHFIFNCLNSIKLYTTQNDTVSAAAYLTKFSKLIRMALENSRSETVTLKAELESLDLYIQMEAMRFKDKLQYSIDVDENVDSNFIEIPPLLLQPYVENAIWHGLMHKEEGGKIGVAVSVLPNEPVLVIAIQDNGVGREKSAELRSNTAGKHKSYGTKVTSERLDLINKVYKTGASVTTEDVKNELGEIAGTLVTIKIPFE